MMAPDNKALYAGLLILAWIILDACNIKDPTLINTIQLLLGGMGVAHITQK